MIKFITISPSSPFNFILNGKVGGGSRFELIFKSELNRLTLVGGVRAMLVKLLDMFLNFNPYRNPSLLNTFEFGG